MKHQMKAWKVRVISEDGSQHSVEVEAPDRAAAEMFGGSEVVVATGKGVHKVTATPVRVA